MTKVIVTIGAVMFVAFAASPLAQARPSFAGTWALVQDSGKVDGAGAGQLSAAPGSLVIKQDDKTLVIAYPQGQTRTIAFEDSKCRNSIAAQGFASVGDSCDATWEGSRLIVAMKENETQVATESWALDANGNLVHRTTPTGPGRVTTDVYRKTK